jgi:uncharacterized protein (DUF2235 family)
MLYKVGLLGNNDANLVEFASKIYNTEGNREVARGFKETFCVPCPVYFIGVWDTVESLVLNAGKKFHDAKLNPEVSYAYHALAIDERRKDFPPYPWDENNVQSHQTMEQVWFAGVHSDVGGYYEDRGLSNLAFQWMMSKAMASGMKVDNVKLASYRGNPHGKLENSFTGFWIFRGKHKRKIEENAKVHESVIERMNEPANDYDPDLPQNYEVVN